MGNDKNTQNDKLLMITEKTKLSEKTHQLKYNNKTRK
jgi:hypothetical protein